MGSSLSRVLLLRVPHYIGDLKRDPDLESYPHKVSRIPKH